MNFTIRIANIHEAHLALNMLKEAAKRLRKNGINQWNYWRNPPQEKIHWVNDGFENKEFYFLHFSDKVIGMFRLLKEDKLYWGSQNEKAFYVHSLVVKEEYSGLQIGKQVLEIASKKAIEEDTFQLRLDCDSSNKKLCEYYENLGFTKVGEKQTKLSLNNLYEKKISGR